MSSFTIGYDILILLLVIISVALVFIYLFFKVKNEKELLELNLYMFANGDVESDYSDFEDLEDIKQEKLQVLDRINRLSKNDYSLDFSDENQSPFDEALKKLIDSLNATKEREEIEKWTQSGLAHFSEVLRSKSDIEELSSHLLGEIVRYIHGNQAAIFLTKPLSDEDYQKHEDLKGTEKLVLSGAYAFDREKHLEMEVMPGEGLVGQTFLEGKLLNFKNVPQDYVTISSGLGDAQPDNLLIMPLANNGSILGVMEIASFQEFKEHEVDFLKNLSETIATTLDVVKINTRTKILLENSTKDAELLKSKENEMQAMISELNESKQEMEANQGRILEVKEKAEEKSKEAQSTAERFELIQNSVGDGVYELVSFEDFDKAKINVSDRFNTMIDAETKSSTKLLGTVINLLKIDYRSQVEDQMRRVASGQQDGFSLEVQFGYDPEYFKWTGKSLKKGNSVEKIAGTLSSLKNKTEKEKVIEQMKTTNKVYNLRSKSISILVKHNGEILHKNIFAEALTIGHEDVLIYGLFDLEIKRVESVSIPIHEGHALGNNKIIRNNLLGVDYSLDFRTTDEGEFLLDVNIDKVNNYGILYPKILKEVKLSIACLQNLVDTYLLGLTKKIFKFKSQVQDLYNDDSIDEVKKSILKSVLGDFTEIIIALQYHDRVTQKMEHVTLQIGDYESLVVTEGLTPEDERLGLFSLICNNNQQQLELIKAELAESLKTAYSSLLRVWSNDDLTALVSLEFFDFHEMWDQIEKNVDRIVGFLSFMKYHSPKKDVDFEIFREEILKYRNVFTMESEREIYDKVFSVIDFESVEEEDSNEDEDGLELF